MLHRDRTYNFSHQLGFQKIELAMRLLSNLNSSANKPQFFVAPLMMKTKGISIQFEK